MRSLGGPSSSMTGVLIKKGDRETHTQREEGMKSYREKAARWLGWCAPQGAGESSFPRASRTTGLWQHLDSGLQVPKTVRRWNSAVSSHSVCGTSCWRPRDRNPLPADTNVLTTLIITCSSSFPSNCSEMRANPPNREKYYTTAPRKQVFFF